MSLTTEHATAADTVASFFALMRAGNTQAALQCWAPGAVWHVTGKSSRAGHYTLSEYLTMCVQWYVDYPQYNAEFGPLTSMGELAFFNIRSRHGEAPGDTEGMMLYRVVDGLITEGWAIPARHGDRYTF